MTGNSTLNLVADFNQEEYGGEGVMENNIFFYHWR